MEKPNLSSFAISKGSRLGLRISVNTLSCQKRFCEISDQFIIELEPFVCQSYILLKRFLLEFYVFLGLSWSFFVRLMVLYLQSMIFSCISPLTCCRKLLQVLAFQRIDQNKFEQSLSQKMSTWIVEVGCFLASCTSWNQELCHGRLKSASTKTQALRRIHLIGCVQSIKNWASLLICNSCSIWQCWLGISTFSLGSGSGFHQDLAFCFHWRLSSLFSSSSSSYLQDLVGPFTLYTRIISWLWETQKVPGAFICKKWQLASSAQAPLDTLESPVHTLVGWSAVVSAPSSMLAKLFQEGCSHLVCNSRSWDQYLCSFVFSYIRKKLSVDQTMCSTCYLHQPASDLLQNQALLQP